MLCKCFNEKHSLGWRVEFLLEELGEFCDEPSWDEAADILWAVWSLFDSAHRNRVAQWCARHITRAKYEKHSRRVKEHGCMRSKRHDLCS